jgi:hypothetical protein
MEQVLGAITPPLPLPLPLLPHVRHAPPSSLPPDADLPPLLELPLPFPGADCPVDAHAAATDAASVIAIKPRCTNGILEEDARTRWASGDLATAKPPLTSHAVRAPPRRLN